MQAVSCVTVFLPYSKALGISVFSLSGLRMNFIFPVFVCRKFVRTTNEHVERLSGVRIFAA